MKNQEIHAAIERITNGDLLSAEEQLMILRHLLRANQRIMEARKQGFAERSRAPTTLPPWDEWEGGEADGNSADDQAATEELADDDALGGDPLDIDRKK